MRAIPTSRTVKVMQSILDQLGLKPVNDGTWLGAESIADESAPLIESFNPSTDELIASVRPTTMEQYEEVITKGAKPIILYDVAESA